MEKHNRIITIDDEEVTLSLLKRILETEGYEVISVSNSRSAVELIADQQPDLILLDITMPGLNGFQLLKLIRQRHDVPVIMLTGRSETDSLCDALSLGADDYVRKPFKRGELLARIKAKIRRTHTETNAPQGE